MNNEIIDSKGKLYGEISKSMEEGMKLWIEKSKKGRLEKSGDYKKLQKLKEEYLKKVKEMNDNKE